MLRGLSVLLLSSSLALTACGGDASAPAVTDPGDAQTPPQGQVNVEAWIATGQYKSWAKEAAVHASRSPSPHGFNRIYSNGKVAANAAGTAVWPIGAAAVKELYKSASDTVPTGYAVYLKTAASAGGAGWYWYERAAADLVADGKGDSGNAKSVCVACHVGAGSDAAHTPTPNGRDFVYTAIQ